MGSGFPRPIANETDLSYYVDTLLKGVSCVQGVCERGPINEATLVGSAEEFERIFGSNLNGYDFPLVCKRALSYGATLWISRVVHQTVTLGVASTEAQAAGVTLKDRASTSAVDTLKVEANSVGTWGNQLKVKVVDSSTDPANLFSLEVYVGDTLAETLTDLSMDDTLENYVENASSNYVTLTDLDSETEAPSNMPAKSADVRQRRPRRTC